MSEQTTILDESVRRLAADMATPDLISAAETGTWPTALWQALVDNGLTLTLVAEEQGGAGATWQEAYVILRAAGHYALPVPLAEHMTAAWLLNQAGLGVPRGVITFATMATGATLSKDGSETLLSGAFERVPWARNARHMVILLPGDGGSQVVSVSLHNREITPGINLAREPRDHVVVQDQVVEVAPAPAGLEQDGLMLYGALARSAQMAGALEYLLGQSVSYANDRIQFGRPISKFQAIQQNLAIQASETAAAGIAAEAAFRAADRGDAAFEIMVAKIRAGEAADEATTIAHAVHGAIGFTYEHALQFATRRLWAWRAEFGDDGYWAKRLGETTLGGGAGALWPYVTSR